MCVFLVLNGQSRKEGGGGEPAKCVGFAQEHETCPNLTEDSPRSLQNGRSADFLRKETFEGALQGMSSPQQMVRGRRLRALTRG